jgi:hypothetical protein
MQLALELSEVGHVECVWVTLCQFFFNPSLGARWVLRGLSQVEQCRKCSLVSVFF